MTTPSIMRWVACALLPGLAAMTWFWGVGILVNAVFLCAFCLLAEAACTYARGGSQLMRRSLTDGSALVTGLLIAICLPPDVAAWPLAVAAAGSIGLAKHAYGGLGRNLFNPAMVGFAIILVAFPAQLAIWPAGIDGLSGATLLSDFRYRGGQTVADFLPTHAAAFSAAQVSAWAFAAGGAMLIAKGLIAWRIPLGMLLALSTCALVGYDQGSSQSLGSPWFHMHAGGLAAAALFVATDPVTHPREPRDQLLFGITIGALVYLIRAFGSYPDGIAFAVLLANCLTPLLDRRRVRASSTPEAGTA